MLLFLAEKTELTARKSILTAVKYRLQPNNLCYTNVYSKGKKLREDQNVSKTSTHVCLRFWWRFPVGPIVCGVSFDKSNHLQRHILTRKHQINNEFHSILRGKTSGDQKLQFVLPAEDTCTPAETEQSQDPPPIDHGDVLFSDGKKNNELESDDIEVNI